MFVYACVPFLIGLFRSIEGCLAPLLTPLPDPEAQVEPTVDQIFRASSHAWDLSGINEDPITAAESSACVGIHIVYPYWSN